MAIDADELYGKLSPERKAIVDAYAREEGAAIEKEDAEDTVLRLIGQGVRPAQKTKDKAFEA